MTQVCAVITATNVQEALEKVARAIGDGAELVEFRADTLDEVTREDVRIFRDNFSGQTVFTYRTNGTRGHGPEVLELIRAAVDAGYEYIDLELPLSSHAQELARYALDSGSIPILSYHGGFADPEFDVPEGCILKSVVPARSMGDLRAIYNRALELAVSGKRQITLASGPMAWVQRMTAPLYAAQMCFAMPDSSDLNGMTTVRALRSAYSALGGFIDSIPDRYYALLGGDVSLSPSPEMFNEDFAFSGENSVYLPFSLDKEQFSNIMQGPMDRGISGGNITMPYKVEGLKYAQKVSKDAEAAGCANTFLARDMSFYNTDVNAFRKMLPKEPGATLLLGYGGAARAAAVVLNERSAQTYVWGRSREKAQAFAREFEMQVHRGEKAYNTIINATPIGARDGAKPPQFIEEAIKNVSLMVDAVYSVIPTMLVRMARRYNVTYYTGGDMLLHQGQAAYTILTGKKEPGRMVNTLMRRGLLDPHAGT